MSSGVSVLASVHHLGLGGKVSRETWRFPQNVTLDSIVTCVVVITYIAICHGGYNQSHCIMSLVSSLSLNLLLLLLFYSIDDTDSINTNPTAYILVVFIYVTSIIVFH